MKKSILTLLLGCLFTQSADAISDVAGANRSLAPSLRSTQVRSDSLPAPVACSACTHVLLPTARNIDGKALNFKPGDVICLQANVQYGALRFININGSETRPIIITACDGQAIVDASGGEYSIKFVESLHFRVTGESRENNNILLTGGKLGMSLDHLSSNFEVDHIEVARVGFAGIIAKTDPTCDDATIQDHFTMRDISIHDNYIHATGGEGIYVGNSFYLNGVKTACGTRLPHDIKGVRIYNNKVEFTGWDGIQLGSAVSGASVHNNSISFYGTANKGNQNSGIQIGEGTGGLCYNNFIKDGSGNGIAMLGIGNNLTAGNVIINAGGSGIFCDDRFIGGKEFQFIDNIIISPKEEGIRLYSDRIRNKVKANLIINPLALTKNASAPLSTDYVYRHSTQVKVIDEDNTYTRNIEEVRDIYEAAFNYNAIDPTAQEVNCVPLKIRDLVMGNKVPLNF